MHGPPRVQTLEHVHPHPVRAQLVGDQEEEGAALADALSRNGLRLQPVDIVDSLPVNVDQPASPPSAPTPADNGTNGADGDHTDARSGCNDFSSL